MLTTHVGILCHRNCAINVEDIAKTLIEKFRFLS